ncbi:protein kinase family protein [Streptomyces sp. NPDC057239]|uniref:protein kinase family protein n=1 Tax=Streptomyces sp. NPDC057239 TaxID=3346061 RepID=UPI0036411435
MGSSRMFPLRRTIVRSRGTNYLDDQSEYCDLPPRTVRPGSISRTPAAQQHHGPFDPPGHQVRVGRLTVDAKDSPVEPHTGVALGCVEALAELHAKGWAHGDVQPAHFIVGPERTHLIDLALARGGHVPEGYDFPFRGCLVHYEAPEIARSVLATGKAEPTQEADIYGLGASLLISATGWRAVEYPDDAPRPVQREAVANGKRRPVKAPGPLGELIDALLSHAPEDRPTIREVGKALS